MTMWLNPGGTKFKSPYDEKIKQAKENLKVEFNPTPEYVASQENPVNSPAHSSFLPKKNFLSSLEQSPTWQKIKVGDIKGLANELGLGLAHGLANTGTARNNALFDQMLAQSKEPGTATYGQQQVANRQTQQNFLNANPVNSLPAMIGEQLPQIPLWMAGEAGLKAVGKGIGKLAPSLTTKAETIGSKLPGFVKGGLLDTATYGSVVAPVESIRNGDNFNQFLEREKQLPGVLLGGIAARGAFQGAGALKAKTQDFLKPLGVPEAPAIPPIAAEQPININNLSSPTKANGYKIKPDDTKSAISEIQVQMDKKVNDIATTLKKMDNQTKIETIRKQVKDMGGISQGNADIFEEQRVIPNWIRNNATGRPLDEVADTLGMTSDELLTAIGDSALKPKDYATEAYKIASNDPEYQALSNTLESLRGQSLVPKAIDRSSVNIRREFAPTIPPKVNRVSNDTASIRTMAADIETPNTTQTFSQQMGTPTTYSSPLTRERQFAQNSVLNSQVAPEILKDEVKQNMPTYEQISNQETFDKATNLVNQDYTKAKTSFNDAKGGVNADDVALGEALITKAIKEGNTDEANTLIADLAEKLTTAGQAVQAASIFKRLTPEGMLMYAQRMVNRANKELFDRLGKKAQKIVLTTEDSNFILETMKNIQGMADGRERDVELAKVMARISNKVPANMGEKIKGIQRIFMLANLKTMIRNLAGNVIFGSVDNMSNALATPLDIATSKITGKRTATLPSFTGQLKSMKKGFNEAVQDSKLGIDTYPGQTQYELPNKRIFDTDILNKSDQVTRLGLQLGDRPFFQAAYDDILRQQMKLAKVDVPTEAMKQQALKIAKERTYQDTNKITEAADGLRNAFNKLGGKSFGAGNIILPFTKTPANILKRAIEYSPIGIEKAVREGINLAKKSGKFDQRAFVDSIARSATGTGIIMAGYYLAQNEVITGTGNKDKDIASFERNLGKSDFAVKFGNTYYTYDWAQPASLALAVGADMFLKGKDKKQAENAIIEGIKSGGETLLKQSFLQGVQRLFGGYAPMDNIEQTAYNAPAQFIPTLFSQIAQFTDSQKRSTNADTVQGKALNSIKAKIPGVSATLEPSVDTFGNPIQQYQGRNNIANVFLNPGKQTTFNPTPVQSEILRVYEATGNKNVFPKIAPNSFTDKGKTITLTPAQVTQFQTTMGKDSERLLAPITSSSYPVEQKAKLMAAALEKAYENAKKEVINKRK